MPTDNYDDLSTPPANMSQEDYEKVREGYTSSRKAIPEHLNYPCVGCPCRHCVDAFFRHQRDRKFFR